MINLQILKITHNLIIKQKRDKQHHLLGISLTREWNLHNLYFILLEPTMYHFFLVIILMNLSYLYMTHFTVLKTAFDQSMWSMEVHHDCKEFGELIKYSSHDFY